MITKYLKVTKAALLVFFMAAIWSCNPAFKTCPAVNNSDMWLETSSSEVFIPISADVTQLVDLISSKIPDTLYHDDDAGGQGVEVEIRHEGTPALDVDGRTIFVTLPLFIKAKRDLGFLKANADGQLFVEVRTEFDISPEWELSTTSTIERVDWVKEPKLSLGGFNMSIKGIIDRYLEQSKEEITRTIDESIAQGQPIQTWIETSKQHFERSYALDPERTFFLQIIPQQASLGPLYREGNRIFTEIALNGRVRLLEDSSQVSEVDEPIFGWISEKESQYELVTTLKMRDDKIEDLMRSAAIGKDFMFKGKKTTIKQVYFDLKDERVHCMVQMDGYFNGDVTFSGIPFWNDDKVSFCNQKIDLNISSGISKFALWLLKGSIEKRILKALEDNINQEIEERLKEINIYLDDFKVSEDVHVKAEVYKYALDPIQVKGKFIHVQMNAGVRGKIQVEDLNIYIQ